MPKKKSSSSINNTDAVLDGSESVNITKSTDVAPANGAPALEANATPAYDDSNNPLFVAPMQLCRPSVDHTYLEAVPETIHALRSVSSGVAVVAGVGSQRIGKSTILNLLHSRKTAGTATA